MLREAGLLSDPRRIAATGTQGREGIVLDAAPDVGSLVTPNATVVLEVSAKRSVSHG